MKDEIYKNPREYIEKFEFSKEVVNVFDDMISRSVPHYELNQIMTAEMAMEYYREGSLIYDLGCSTGKTAKVLDKVFGKRKFKYFGIDNSGPMVEECRKIKDIASKGHQLQFELGNIEEMNFQDAGVVISNYTLQFIPVERRPDLLNKIFKGLVSGGAFLLCEKVIEENKIITDHFIKMHHKMKKEYGYSDLEIIQKRDAIENVLIPSKTMDNLELLKNAGFRDVGIYHKWYNFASYIAIKNE